MKKATVIILLFILSFFVFACSKQTTPSSMYLWKPKTKEARFLKAEYIQNLSELAETLVEYGNKVQFDGVGFTTNYKCVMDSCTKEENAQNWLFVVIEEKTVDPKKYKTYEERAAYITKKKLADVLFAMKKDFIINSNGKINGVLVSFIWSNAVFKKETSYESVDIYIDIDTFKQYQNKNITINDLYAKAVFIDTTKEKKYVELPF